MQAICKLLPDANVLGWQVFCLLRRYHQGTLIMSYIAALNCPSLPLTEGTRRVWAAGLSFLKSSSSNLDQLSKHPIGQKGEVHGLSAAPASLRTLSRQHFLVPMQVRKAASRAYLPVGPVK